MTDETLKENLSLLNSLAEVSKQNWYNTDVILKPVIVQSLFWFLVSPRIGVPFDVYVSTKEKESINEWNNILKDIIFAFSVDSKELSSLLLPSPPQAFCEEDFYDSFYDEEDIDWMIERQKKGRTLFIKYFDDLWD